MSGVEFVAVLGIAASALQVVESCTKIIKRIRQYRQAVAFEDIIVQLELFSRDVDYLSSPAGRQVLNPLTETVVLNALDGCRRHLGRLDEIAHSLIPAANSTKLKRTIYGIRSVRKDKEIRDIIGVLSTYQLTIQFHLLRCNMQTTAQILDRIDFPKEKIPAAISMESMTPADNGSSSLILGDHDTTAAHWRPQKFKHNQKRSSKCARGVCTCSCHVSKKSSSVSWMAISLLQTVFYGCEDREYAIALHLFRTICILHLSLHWQEGVAIKCGLDYHGTVNYTSPGFMILHRCREGLMDLQQARNELRVLREKGEINFKEVDPSGDGWIEASSLIPYLPQNLPKCVYRVSD